MDVLKINFGFFWDGFDITNNYFTKPLSKLYKLEISDDPDLYFFTHSYYNGNRDYLKYKCHRVFLGWENFRADWTICDYVLDSDFYHDNPRHKRFPIWAGWDMKKLCLPKDMLAYKEKKKFCCMLVSNPKAKERIEFFHKLSEYKKVDSAGRYLNNIGHGVENKMEFIKDYKFVISFENSSYPGYTTEKLIEPMFSNTIPIYWGNPRVGEDFNTKSFVNINDFGSYDDAIRYIIELDTNEEKYLEMAAQPWLNNNQIAEEFSSESLQRFLDYIVKDAKTRKPVAKSLYKQGIHQYEILKRKLMWRLRLIDK